MFNTLTPKESDPILAVMEAFAADQRPAKIDLGVGVYKNLTGQTPVMAAVKQAELDLHNTQTTKTYLGMSGDPGFCEALNKHIFQSAAPQFGAMATVGGTGAIFMLAKLINEAEPGSKIWVPATTWPNHLPVLKSAGLEIKTYPYLDASNQSLDFAKMAEALSKVGANETVLFHGCCHNPTGVDLSADQWDQVADLAKRQGFTCFVDLAYWGLGTDLDTDAYGIRTLAAKARTFLAAVSCSKNFGLYRDRVGLAFVKAQNAEQTLAAKQNFLSWTRNTISMPPAHGQELVRTILNDATLTAQWQAELADMCKAIKAARAGLAASLRRASNSNEFDFIERQNGMFSVLYLDANQVAQLRNDHAVYVVPGGRINIAGVRPDQNELLAQALVAVKTTD